LWAVVNGRAKRQVEEMFLEERPQLKALPIESFRYFTEGTRTVQDDTTVQVDGAWYAARPAPIGPQVLVRCYPHEIEIRDLRTVALIRRHTRAEKKGEVYRLPDLGGRITKAGLLSCRNRGVAARFAGC